CLPGRSPATEGRRPGEERRGAARCTRNPREPGSTSGWHYPEREPVRYLGGTETMQRRKFGCNRGGGCILWSSGKPKWKIPVEWTKHEAIVDVGNCLRSDGILSA